MVMSRSLRATTLMVSLILLIPAFAIAITLPASERQLENIMEAIEASQDYHNWVEVLAATDPYTFPVTATFLMPVDNSFINTAASSPESVLPTTAYHVIGQQLPFSVLQTFKVGSRIPTLLPEKTILVTNNSKSNYTIDGVQITNPDMYMNGAFVVHGIKTSLNYTVYGSEDSLKQSTGGVLDNDHDHKTKNETQSTGGVLDNDHDHKRKNETQGGGRVHVSSGAAAQLPFNNWGSLINSGVIITCLYLFLG